MRIEINQRGNGACPLCKNHNNCNIQTELRESIKRVDLKEEMEMELVIYRCPKFKEKF